MKVFLDTNIWLRFLLKDDPKFYPDCVELIKAIENGHHSPYTSTIVLLEISYVLGKIYQLSTKEVINTLKQILKTRNLVLIEKTNFRQAIKVWQNYKIKLADSLIVTQIPKNSAFCTLDRDFRKIPHLEVQSPDLLKTL